jgi:hypothetical protein
MGQKESHHENVFIDFCRKCNVKPYSKSLDAFRLYRKKIKESRYQGEMM